jgi:hypothetical protein
MGTVKNFRISTSLRTKAYELLSRYEPSDLAYTIGGSLYDRSNKMLSTPPHSKEHGEELRRKKECYMKAAKRFLSIAKSLKLLEMQYLQ